MISIKSSGDRRPKILSHIYHGLIICLVVLGVIFIGGTIYGVFLKSNTSIPTHSSTQINGLLNNGKGQTFTGIGPLRVTTAEPQPGIVILYVLFTYYPDDKAFSEELALRIKDFRDIIMSYIGSFSAIDLQKQGEELIKAELLHRFNSVLRLGQIDSLYFSDFMIVG